MIFNILLGLMGIFGLVLLLIGEPTFRAIVFSWGTISLKREEEVRRRSRCRPILVIAGQAIMAMVILLYFLSLCSLYPASADLPAQLWNIF